jgi:hypothetical protein
LLIFINQSWNFLFSPPVFLGSLRNLDSELAQLDLSLSQLSPAYKHT